MSDDRVPPIPTKETRNIPRAMLGWFNDIRRLLQLALDSISAGGAPANSPFVAYTATGLLSAERVLTDSATVEWDITTPDQVAANVVDVPAAALPAEVVLDTEANNYALGAKQTFGHSGATAGLNLNPATGDPSGPANGDLWYNSTTGKFRKREGGVTSDLGAAGGGGLTKGQGVIDFGAFPGGHDASLVITGQAGILGTSFVSADLLVADSADHSADEHWAETLEVRVGSIVAGTGFTIYAKNANQINTGNPPPALYGQFNVQWAWSN